MPGNQGNSSTIIQTACDRCTQGVMDSENDHLHGRCRCACHLPAERVSGDSRAVAQWPASTITWVRQEHPDGCGIACLAMVTDQSYEQVKDDLLADPWMADSEFVRKDGNAALAQPVLEKYLTERGWFFRRIYSAWQLGAWPPPPFAERHYAIVANPGGGHFVAMSDNGTVYDPLREGTYRLTDWDVVNCVVGLLPQQCSEDEL